MKLTGEMLHFERVGLNAKAGDEKAGRESDDQEEEASRMLCICQVLNCSRMEAGCRMKWIVF